jgi:hypothetical protein
MAYKNLINATPVDLRVALLVREGATPDKILDRAVARLAPGERRTVTYGDDNNPFLSGIKLTHTADGSDFMSRLVVDVRGSRWDDVLNRNDTLTFTTTDARGTTGSNGGVAPVPTEPPPAPTEPPAPAPVGRYTVENQWGGSSAPWHAGGTWVLGARAGQPVVAIDVRSADGGATLTGTMTYRGEGPIGFRGTRTAANTYRVENQWGGSAAPWHEGGVWTIGGRANQNVIALSVSSADQGTNLTGTMTYAGEGPIGFRGASV